MELHDVPIFWWESNSTGTLSLYSSHTCIKLKGLVLEMRLLWCRTGICSWIVSVEGSLMLDGPFSVSFLCFLKYISFYFIQNSMQVTSKWLIPFNANHIILNDPQCFGRLAKFQHRTQIFMWMTRVPRPVIPCSRVPFLITMLKFSLLSIITPKGF